MTMTCIEPEIFLSIFPTLLAIFPETPLSISSKMIVGRRFFCDINDLILNISLDNSPPEAIFDISLKTPPLFALNKNFTLSKPSIVSSLNFICSTLNLPSGIPSCERSSVIFFSIFGIASPLFAEILLANFINPVSIFDISFFSSSISFSSDDISLSFSVRFSLTEINSSTLLTRCFC